MILEFWGEIKDGISIFDNIIHPFVPHLFIYHVFGIAVIICGGAGAVLCVYPTLGERWSCVQSREFNSTGQERLYVVWNCQWPSAL